jgi:AcrR family transcriptional regulator
MGSENDHAPLLPVSEPVRHTAATDATAGSARSDGSAESPSRNQQKAAGRRRGRPLSPAVDERVLDAALDMLAENGYAGLRLDALAARAGVAKTTILRRWPSKATVAAAAVERLALQTIDVPESGTLRDDLHTLLTSAVTVFTDGQGSFVPRLIRESGHHHEIANLLDTVIHTRRLAYRRVLGRAIARHELDPDVDQELLIDLLVGPVWTRLLITHDPITPSLINEIVDAVTRAFPTPQRSAGP